MKDFYEKLLDLKNLNIKMKVTKMKQRPQEIEVGMMNHTEKQFSWIKKLCYKKKSFKHSNFMRALLRFAMNQTAIELRTKQRLRRNGWN